MKPSRTMLALLALALCALVWGVFGQTVRHPFVNYDDDSYVTENPIVRAGLTTAGVRWAFTAVHSDNWHPLTTLSHMLDCSLFGMRAGRHHLVNVLLHSAASVLCLLAFWRLTGAVWRSAFVAAVFAVHPVHVESVAWVAERKDVLSGFFFMLTLLVYASYARRPTLVRYLAVAAAFTAGLMSKPMLVSVPFVLLLLDYWPLRRFAVRADRTRLFLEKAPLLALAGAVGLITLHVQHLARSVTVPLQLSLGDRLANAAVSCVIYLQQTLWPARLAAFYPHPRHSLTLAQIALALAVLLALTFIAWRSARRRPYLLVGWGWFLVMLLPVIGIIQVGVQAHADRYLYLPQTGVVFAATWLAVELAASRRWLRFIGAPAVATVLLFAFVAWKQTGYWRDSETLWRHTLAVTSRNDIAHYNLANALMENGRPAEAAIASYEAALIVRPDEARTHSGLALALFQTGRAAEAFTEWEKTLVLKPDSPEARNNYGVALLLSGRAADAVAIWSSNLERHRDDLGAILSLGWVRATQVDAGLRDGAKAVAFAEAANQLTGRSNPTVWRVMAAAAAETGHFANAEMLATRALAAARTYRNEPLAQSLEADLARYRQKLPVRTEREPIPFR